MSVVQTTLLLFLIFFGLMFIGVPISVAIGSASIAVLLTGFSPSILSYVVAQRCFKGLDSFSLLALPFFMLAGNIMNKGGIARRLVRLARKFVGKIPGYLAATNVLTNMFFGAISGSSIAAASAVGKIMGPLEKDEGYEDAYSAAVNICSAPTGVIIPPSGPLILFAITAGTGVSVSALFMAGYIPGILLGLSVMIVAIILATKHGYTGSKVKDDDSTLRVLIDAGPCIMMMVIVMGGILAGWFTATEAGVVACLYCILLSFFYKELTLKQLWGLMADCMMDTATILFLIAASNIMSYAMAYSGIPVALSNALMGITDNKYVMILIINVFLLVLGMFLDLTPAVLIFTPIFLPIVKSMGMSEVHFGVMLILNLAIGSVTPPVGSVLFVGCNVGNVTIEQVTKYIIPMFCAMVVALMLTAYIPACTLFLPKLCGLVK